MQSSDTNNNLAQNTDNNAVSKQVSQRNNGEEIKENRRVEEIASSIRNSYRANQKELKGSDLEDFEKQVTLKYAKENNLWYKDILLFGL